MLNDMSIKSLKQSKYCCLNNLIKYLATFSADQGDLIFIIPIPS